MKKTVRNYSKYRRKALPVTSMSIALAVSILLGMSACGNSAAESTGTVSGASAEANYESFTEAGSWQLPEIVEDSSMSTGQRTTWECVYFGEYPQTEIVDGDFTAVDDYALQDGDYISDQELYSELVAADWTDNITELDGTKYCRITGTDAVTASTNRTQHYRWGDTGEYHYFRYDKIRWRIVDEQDGILTLVSNRILEGGKFNATEEDVSWSDSTIRAFLNSEFYGTAFNETEKAAVVCSDVENTPNAYYNTDCGGTTQDYVYLLSNDEVFNSDTAAGYGFMAKSGYDDASKRFTSTLYAKCRGVWWSPVEDYRGNSFWMMRTSGYTASNVSYICDFGYIYDFGTSVICDDAGVLPMIRLDTSKYMPEAAGKVSSDEIVKEKTSAAEDTEEISISTEDSEESDSSSEEQALPDTEDVIQDYETMELGTYPQTEIVGENFTAVDEYALQDGDYELDPELYQALEQAEWTDNITELDGDRYMRITASDTSYAASGRKAHYDWADLSAWHYFRFDPITWRILQEEDGKYLLMADRALDCVSFHDEAMDVVWAESSLRTWLNEDFYHLAFTGEEQTELLDTVTENANNHYFGTACGETTTDKVFLLAEADTFYTDEAVENGFSELDYGEDPARRISSTLFAKCRGTWWSPADDRDGNCFWILRTSGYNNSNVVYVDENGDMFNRGCFVTVSDTGIVPAICIAAE